MVGVTAPARKVGGQAERSPYLASVVIPAHNEQNGIAATLRALHDGLPAGALDVVVVCNGCTDSTADVVRRTFPEVRVIEREQPSKAAAVVTGNDATDVFPRVHLDADIQISGATVRALVSALGDGVHAAGPTRVLDRTGSPLLVRWYYDVWETLPQVESGLFGRGVFALSEEGQRRVSALPRLMSDDLAASEAFAPAERRVVAGAESVVALPRRTNDLIRRRVRVVTGNFQATEEGAASASSATGLGALGRIALRRPALVPRLAVFLGITAVARLRARRAINARDFDTWLRDDSSRGVGEQQPTPTLSEEEPSCSRPN